MRFVQFSRHFSSHAFGVLFFASSLAVFAAALLGLSRTVGNAAVLGAALFLLIPYLVQVLQGIRPRIAVFAAVVVGWIVSVYLIYGQRSGTGTIRLGVLLFYVVVFLAAGRGFREGTVHIRVLWKWLFAATTVFILVSNFVDAGLLSAVVSPAIRYEGIDGPNRHGLLAAYGAIACALFLGEGPRRRRRWVLFGLAGFFLLNLWASGSRAAMLTLLAYFAVLYYKRVLQYGYYIALIPILLIGAVVWLVATGRIQFLVQFLRIDEGAGIRLRAMLWGYKTIVGNHFLPHGFATIREAPGELILDSAYLWLTIETGLVGLLLVLGIFLSSMLSGFRYVRRVEAQSKNGARALKCTALLGSVAVHAVFETHLFVGLAMDTVIFLTHAPYLLQVGATSESG